MSALRARLSSTLLAKRLLTQSLKNSKHVNGITISVKNNKGEFQKLTKMCDVNFCFLYL